MNWKNKHLLGRSKVAGLLAVFIFAAAFLTVTDNSDRDLNLWQRWTNSTKVSAAGSENSLLKQVSSIDLPGPKGKRFDYLTIDASLHLLFSTHLGADLLYVVDLLTNKLATPFKDLP